MSMRSIHWLGAEGTNLSLPNLKSMLEVWKSKLFMRSFHFGGGGTSLAKSEVQIRSPSCNREIFISEGGGNLKLMLEVQLIHEKFHLQIGGGEGTSLQVYTHFLDTVTVLCLTMASFSETNYQKLKLTITYQVHILLQDMF